MTGQLMTGHKYLIHFHIPDLEKKKKKIRFHVLDELLMFERCDYSMHIMGEISKHCTVVCLQ